MAGKNDLDTKGLEAVKFGEEIRKSEFCLRPGSTFINNGSYGTVPTRVLDVQKRYLDQFESHPDHWLRRTVRGGWDEARQVVADFVGADVEDVVFVMNATTGVNTVLRSYRLSPGDAIVATSLSYGALKNLWMEFVESICPGVELLFLEIKMPITSEDDLVQQFDDFFAQHTNIKFALIDHISSPSSILMPVKRLAQVCRKHGAMVIVDGAHAPGQVHLNLKELDVDFYSGNMHKWVYTPRGSAFLWVRREHHATVRPPIMSWAKGMSLSEQFFVQGTRDHIPFLCAKHGLQFYQAIGGMDKVVGYTSHLATVGRDLLAEELGLDRLDIPPSMEAPNLRMLKLPGVPQSCSGIKDKRTAALKLQDDIYREHDIQTIFDWVDGALYLRISVQVHTTLDDFRKVIPVMKRLLATCSPYNK